MIRVLVYLAIVAAIAFAAVWLAERPGEVAITWQGSRVDTSVMVLIVTVAAVAVATTLLWSIVRFIMRSPMLFARARENRRGARGYRAVSRGLIAVGSGDIGAARKFAEEAKRIAPGEPLTLLLSAQTAQLAGDKGAAVRNFEQMAGRDDTRLLGLHGLYIEARRRNDPRAALFYAEEAARHAAPPATVPLWAGQAVLEFRCMSGDWPGAIERLERNYTSGLIDKQAYRRQRAVLLTAQALALEDTDRERAKAQVLEAVKLAPTLVPAAALAGRMLGEAGELRKAARAIEAAWVWNPHPDLADAAAHLRPGDSARERLARIEALAAKSSAPEPQAKLETALAVARSAIDAQEFARAREVLAAFVAAPTRKVAALMAELELRSGDEGRAREWMQRALVSRRDPAWTADGFVSERWLPVSPVTGRLDAFEWKDPLAGDEPSGALIEASERTALEPPREAREAVVPVPERIPPPEPSLSAPHPSGQQAPLREETRVSATATSPRLRGEVGRLRPGEGDSPRAVQMESPPHPTPLPASGEREQTDRGEKAQLDSAASQDVLEQPRPRRGRAVIPLAPAVIPLVHAPDDPGPEPQPESQIEPEPEPSTDNWSKLRQLFRS
jgi:HemY protein